MIRAYVFALAALSIPLAAQSQPETKAGTQSTREATVRLVEQVKRADYEGDRPALKRLHAELAPPSDDKLLAARVLYWRGFALWRSAINGFNETPTPADLGDDLNAAISDFKGAIASDPGFVEPKIGAGSCYGYLMYLNRADHDRVQDLIAQGRPFLKEALAMDPENPRLLWVMGPIRWSTPPERGGGQDKAFELYNKGLEVIRKQKPVTDPMQPSWGEPELLMNIAWSDLNQTKPDLAAAQQNAEAALKIVPYWHYVRDILMPQIQAAKAKASTP